MIIVTPKQITLNSSRCNITATTEAEYASTTTYATSNVVKLSFANGTTTAVNAVKTFKSLEDGNVGNYPEGSSQWSDLGATNRWKMFDSYVTTQTSGSTAIKIEVQSNKISHFAAFNLSATSISWWLRDSSDTTVTSGTIGLSLSTPISTVTHKSDVIQAVNAWVFSGKLEVHIDKSTSAAKCGHFAIGNAETIGETLYGVQTEHLDYSNYETNAYGYTALSQGNWAKNNRMKLYTKNAIADRVFTAMADARSTPVIWDANENDSDYEPLLLFGWYRKFELMHESPFSTVTLNLKGMV